MQYVVKHNGATYILPTFTRGMKKKIDEVNERIANPENPVDDRVDALYGFVTDTLGEENQTNRNLMQTPERHWRKSDLWRRMQNPFSASWQCRRNDRSDNERLTGHRDHRR